MGQCLSCCDDEHRRRRRQRRHSPATPNGHAAAPPLQQTQQHLQLVEAPSSCPVPSQSPQVIKSAITSSPPPADIKKIKRSSPGVDANQISEQKINALFDNYRDCEQDEMLADGMEKFCEDLQVKPDDFRMLVLAWKFKAERMCYFSRSEVVNGCKALNVDSMEGIQKKLPDLVEQVKVNDQFKDLYRWTYKFGLESGQRTLPTDVAIALWRLVFSQNEPPLLERWLEFLSVHPAIRGIPRDTWDMLLNLVQTVGDDLSAYDDTEAWPSLFDDFVEYENDRQNQNVSYHKDMKVVTSDC